MRDLDGLWNESEQNAMSDVVMLAHGTDIVFTVFDYICLVVALM